MKKQLGEIANLKYGKMPNKDLIRDSGYPIFTGYKISGFYPIYMYDKSVIIVVARGVGGTGDVKIAPPKSFITNLSIIVDIINDKLINKKYLQLLLGSLNLRNLDSGSAQSQITIAALSKVELDLPKKDIQDEIASKIELIERKIQLNKRINDNLLKFTTAYFDSVKKEQYVALKKLLDVRDGTHNSPKQQKTGYPLVTSKAIKENTIDFSKTKLISKLDFEEINKRSKVNTNDILVSMIGTVGIIYKVIENPVNFAIKNVGLIKAGETSDLANLVYLYLISKEGQSYINSHLSGSTQQFISLSTLRNLPIPTLDNFTIDQINKIGELLLLITQNSKQNVILTALRNEILNKFF